MAGRTTGVSPSVAQIAQSLPKRVEDPEGKIPRRRGTWREDSYPRGTLDGLLQLGGERRSPMR